IRETPPSEPCPKAIDKAKGCIYLGIISDLTEGPFRALAVPVTDAQKAFWDRVNKAGGIGSYEVDVTSYIRDNKYNPQVHAQVYQEIKPKILALAQTLGSSTTLAVLADMKSSNLVGAPASWTSAWAFEDVIVESGTNYCLESMNMLDYAKEKYGATSAMAVHFAGDYGADAAAGAKLGAEKLGMAFQRVETGPGAEAQAGAIAAIIKAKPSVVILSTSPTEAAAIVGGAVAQGFTGRFIGSGPTWNPALLKSPAAAALTASYEHSGYWGPWGSNTPGHNALREAMGNVQNPNDGYTYGWVWSYPLKAALQKAVASKDLTRAGLVSAVKSLTSVDYEGILPSGSGNFASGLDGVTRSTQFSKPDAGAPTGITVVKPFSAGPTASAYKLTGPCYKSL
ncbi:MAG TPA: branched-chain amino acid ABC transporter substrate-binding protein, partial [Micromonosporaceae bacterium]|nr:branched-chain amino acid ABC transporter substrate-binding protein [Micromonosporaceae bacterium]